MWSEYSKFYSTSQVQTFHVRCVTHTSKYIQREMRVHAEVGKNRAFCLANTEIYDEMKSTHEERVSKPVKIRCIRLFSTYKVDLIDC